MQQQNLFLKARFVSRTKNVADKENWSSYILLSLLWLIFRFIVTGGFLTQFCCGWNINKCGRKRTIKHARLRSRSIYSFITSYRILFFFFFLFLLKEMRLTEEQNSKRNEKKPNKRNAETCNVLQCLPEVGSAVCIGVAKHCCQHSFILSSLLYIRPYIVVLVSQRWHAIVVQETKTTEPVKRSKPVFR